ncbi:MAG: ArnT family glycosyltransferase [Marinifilaceae bacterium]
MSKRSYIYLIIFLLPLLIGRDFTPNNELRYLSIANEAISNGSLFTFTHNGEIYADKPPLYLWIVMLGKWLFGHHAMWWLSMFSFIPALITINVMDKWVSPLILVRSRKAAGYALITTGMFLGAAIVIRMDMLMIMFITMSLKRFYNIYRNDYTRWDEWLLPIYIFLALFTKGPVGILLPLLVMIVFLTIKHQFKTFFTKYMGWKQWLILLSLCGLWFLAVALEGGYEYLHNLLFKQTVGRAVEGFHHKEPWWYYGVHIWTVWIPWSLFYGAAILIAFYKKYLHHDLEQLFATVILTTIVMLSFSSSKLSIYLLPMIPFATYLAVLLCRRIEHKYLYWTVMIPSAIMALALPAALIAWYLYIQGHAPVEIEINDIPWAIPFAIVILTYFGVLALVYLRGLNLYKGIKLMSTGIVCTIFVASLNINAINPYIGFRSLANTGKNLAFQYGIHQYGFYRFRAGEDMQVYLNSPVEKLTLEQVYLRRDRGDMILFLRNKDIHRTPELQDIIASHKQINVGQYTIVVFENTHIPLSDTGLDKNMNQS